MGKRVSTRRLKKHRLYTYEEAAAITGLTAQTIRSWRQRGLIVMASSTPHYILGEALIEFITVRQAKRSVTLGANQMYCLRCKGPRSPLGSMVDFVEINGTRGRLTALCEDCEKPLHRYVSKSALLKFRDSYDIAIRSTS